VYPKFDERPTNGIEFMLTHSGSEAIRQCPLGAGAKPGIEHGGSIMKSDRSARLDSGGANGRSRFLHAASGAVQAVIRNRAIESVAQRVGANPTQSLLSGMHWGPRLWCEKKPTVLLELHIAKRLRW
jgi:hypothetical protein